MRERSFAASSQFKLIFVTVIILTVLTGVAQIVLASAWSTPNQMQQGVFEAMGFAWKAGFGAIIGLLSGKQAKLGHYPKAVIGSAMS